GAPNFAYNLCISKITEEQRTGLDLSSWDLAANAAEPVRADTIERFVKAFESCGFRREAFKAGYGLAESTFLVTNPARGTLPVIKRFDKNALEQNRIIDASDTDVEVKSLVGCGKILPQGKIVIVDPNSLKECQPDKIGEIWVSSPSVAKGYWNRPDETRQTFGATLADTGEGPFLRT
ncbi:MAG: fatty acyl-AMP ligase, partial [bacterium]|nr:fatty acyl-AMP ligase [bacterium]